MTTKAEMPSNDVEFEKLAVEEARKSIPESGRIPLHVGAIAVKDGVVLGQAHRSQENAGDHAEYVLLEHVLKNADLEGTTVFATLEPCTLRSASKTPCAQRLIDRKVARVVVGTLDPNPDIRGLGYQALRTAGIQVDLFEAQLVTDLEELNAEFFRVQRAGIAPPRPSKEFLAQAATRRLDDWYRALNTVYFHRNFDRDLAEICLHLIEVIGGLSLLASKKVKPGIDRERQVPKAVGWWLALCGKVGIRSVEQMLWLKFPGVCPYCQQKKHDQELCAERKGQSPGPDWNVLAGIGEHSACPTDLAGWQRMFNDIYPAAQTDTFPPIFARLYEELAELSEAVRVFRSVPGYFLSEAADVFAWLMRVQNVVDEEASRRRQHRGIALQEDFARAYPDACNDCGRVICGCPPIPASTIGRIAHEVPNSHETYGTTGSFVTPDKAASMFAPANLIARALG